MEGKLSKAEFKAIVFSDNSVVHARFAAEFGTEIDACIDQFTQTYGRFKDLGEKIQLNKRTATVLFFLYIAIDNVVTSLHLLISGLLAPSGNLMRHFAEAAAMALLCSHPKIDTFDRFYEKPGKFPMHKVLDIVSRKKNVGLLDLNKQRWEQFKKMTGFYDKFSHSSALSAASKLVFSIPGGVAMGGEFDSEKSNDYRKEIHLRKSAMAVILHMIEKIEQRLVVSNSD